MLFVKSQLQTKIEGIQKYIARSTGGVPSQIWRFAWVETMHAVGDGCPDKFVTNFITWEN